MIYNPFPVGRTCNACSEWKPFAEYYRAKRSNGIRVGSQCKDCIRTQSKSRYHYPYQPPTHLPTGMIYLPYPVGKVCRVCGQWKPFAELVPEKRVKYGVDRCCKTCRRGENTAYRVTHREIFRAAGRKYAKRARQEHPERFREQDRKYAKANPEKIREWSKQGSRRQRQNDPEGVRRRKERYLENHADEYKEAVKAGVQRRRARKRNLPDTFTVTDWHRALDYFHGCCAVCGRPLSGLFHRAAADHWIPLSSPDCPGTIPTNIVPLCHSQKGGTEGCNNTKLSRNPLEWLLDRFGDKAGRAKFDEIDAFFKWVKQQSGY